MRLDEAIEFLEDSAETWNEKRFKRISKWLKELKELRKQVKHCKAVHGAFFNELAEQGIIT